MPAKIELHGRRFGRLLVIREAPKVYDTPRKWICYCDCGNTSAVVSQMLRTGRVISCGCYRNEQAGQRTRTHGKSGTREHQKWKAAIGRCYNSKNRGYPRWGGRGITMAPEWRHDFARFLADMGPCPKGYQLDRVDNDGPYAPGNCKWSTFREQANNRSNNIRVLWDGRPMTLQEALRASGSTIKYITAHYRITRLGWSIHDALTRPPDCNKSRH